MFDYLAINSQLSDKVYALGAKRQLEYIFRKHFGLEGPKFLYFDGFFLETKLHEIARIIIKITFQTSLELNFKCVLRKDLDKIIFSDNGLNKRESPLIFLLNIDH